jgi:hypothetical protein
MLRVNAAYGQVRNAGSDRLRGSVRVLLTRDMRAGQ